MDILFTLQSGAAQGLWWAILTLGVFITYRLLNFADLTVEGSFPLGAAVTVILINAGVNPFLAILAAFAAGCAAGLCTALLNTLCKIPPILSGILTMIALYSINLRIMGDKAVVTLSSDTVKTAITKLLPIGSVNTISLICGAVMCLLLVGLLYAFFSTEMGCAVRATGENPIMASALGVNTKRMTMLALALSNGLIAVSGSMIAQFDYGSALVTMGQGTIVIGLASIIIGEVIFCRRNHGVAYMLMSVVFGAIIYRCIIAVALRVNFLKATDLKIITAITVAAALSLPVIKKNVAMRKLRNANRKAYSKGAEGDSENA